MSNSSAHRRLCIYFMFELKKHANNIVKPVFFACSSFPVDLAKITGREYLKSRAGFSALFSFASKNAKIKGKKIIVIVNYC